MAINILDQVKVKSLDTWGTVLGVPDSNSIQVEVPEGPNIYRAAHISLNDVEDIEPYDPGCGCTG